MHALVLVVQWVATAISILGSFWLGNRDRRHRHWGFAVLLASNGLWGWWSVDAHAWGLLTTQVVYVVLNLRGLLLSDPVCPPTGQSEPAQVSPDPRPSLVAGAPTPVNLGAHAPASQR